MENLMNSGLLHYCEYGGKGKMLSANHWDWVGYVVRSADSDCCLPSELGLNVGHFQSPNGPALRAYP
jgi:hypothetical protein